MWCGRVPMRSDVHKSNSELDSKYFFSIQNLNLIFKIDNREKRKKKKGITGNSFINFTCYVKVYNNICSVYSKFNVLSCSYRLSFLEGPVALYGFVDFLNPTGPSLPKIIYA